jgi:hypothetical protein
VKHELRDPQIAQFLTSFRKGSGSGDVGCVEVALVLVDRD